MPTERTIVFFVPGIPGTAGSKRGFVNPKTKRVIIVDDNRKAAPWRQSVLAAAMRIYTDVPLTGPVVLTAHFYFPRPKCHYGSGRNADVLKDGAPRHHITKPDATKLLRALEDALTAVIWRDDNQVVEQHVEKMYGPRPGVLVTISTKGSSAQNGGVE